MAAAAAANDMLMMGGGGGPAMNNAPQQQQQQAVNPDRVRDAIRMQIRDSFRQFLDQFLRPEELPDTVQRRVNDAAPFYIHQLARLTREQHFCVFMVRWADFVDFDESVAAVVEESFLKYSSALDEALEQLLEEEADPEDSDFVDRESRRKNGTLPTVAFTHVPMQWTVRTLRASHVGHLCSIGGTVTRTSQVRPELLVGVFRCNDCGTESEPIEQQFKYTEPPTCRNGQCDNKRFWTLVTDAKNTVFGDWQKLRVQENANEIPVGCMPRSVEVVVRGSAVEAAKPGDRIIAVGCPIVVPEVAKLFNILNRREVQKSMSGGQRAMGEDGAGGGGGGGGGAGNNAMDGATGLKILGVRDLNYKLSFLAQVIADTNYDTRRMTDRNLVTDPDSAAAGGGGGASEFDSGAEIVRLTDAERDRVLRMRHSNSFIDDMANCIAPNVFSHHLVKLGLLLQMIGGVPKRTQEKINLRGDINCCIVGDPSTAKSHLLKWVANLVPRGVYTSGKASSASGLTATITRDADTGERTIEAGALMLADHGVCCIDEFDKMDIRDQVAIHEAMEQQTISIAKAGIKATLNARASLLAALNPIGGKYDRRKPLQKNVAITAPIMSRFDLMFCIVDDGDASSDRELAQQIVALHGVGGEEAKAPPFEVADVQLYIRFSRSLQPKLTDAANAMIVKAYRALRLQDALANRSKVFRVTTRLLESIIRLSEATAKVYLEDLVLPRHVQLALELMQASLTTVDMTQIELNTSDLAGGAFAGDEDDDDDDAAGGGNGGNDDDGFGGGGTQRPQATQNPQQLAARRQHAETQQHQHQQGAGQQQQQQQQQKKMVISADEYNRVQHQILNHCAAVRSIRSAEEGRGTAEDALTPYPQKNDIVKGIVSKSTSNDQNVLKREVRMVQLVLVKLVQEGKLIFEDDSKTTVLLHPDFQYDAVGE